MRWRYISGSFCNACIVGSLIGLVGATHVLANKRFAPPTRELLKTPIHLQFLLRSKGTKTVSKTVCYFILQDDWYKHLQ